MDTQGQAMTIREIWGDQQEKTLRRIRARMYNSVMQREQANHTVCMNRQPSNRFELKQMNATDTSIKRLLQKVKIEKSQRA